MTTEDSYDEKIDFLNCLIKIESKFKNLVIELTEKKEFKIEDVIYNLDCCFISISNYHFLKMSLSLENFPTSTELKKKIKEINNFIENNLNLNKTQNGYKVGNIDQICKFIIDENKPINLIPGKLF